MHWKQFTNLVYLLDKITNDSDAEAMGLLKTKKDFFEAASEFPVKSISKLAAIHLSSKDKKDGKLKDKKDGKKKLSNLLKTDRAKGIIKFAAQIKKPNNLMTIRRLPFKNGKAICVQSLVLKMINHSIKQMLNLRMVNLMSTNNR